MTFSNRFRVLETLSLKPGCCYACKGTSGGPFIDTGVDIEWEGAVYLCKRCLREMADALGLFDVVVESEPPAPQITLSDITGMVEATLHDGNISTAKMVGVLLNAYVDSVFSGVDDSHNTSSTPVLEVGEGEKTEPTAPTESDSGNAEDRSGDTAKSDDSSVKVSKSSGKSRRDDVPSATGDGESSTIDLKF